MVFIFLILVVCLLDVLMLDGLVLLEFKNNLIVLFVEFFVNWNELDVFLCIWNGINCMLIGYV